ncbi:MAG TPA: hypothetical protein VMP08_10310 [Anaerolineae bacterium]|nr:hypothetical protein [Anaerolineae bacterium]
MIRRFLALLMALCLITILMTTGCTQPAGTPTPTSEPAPTEGTPEAVHHHAQGNRIEAGDALVKIVSPQDGDVIKNNSFIVRVETLNWPLGEQGHHWHLYVNGAEQGMSQGNSPALQARDLQPGENTIEVVLSNELHQELNATDTISVRYEP